MHAFSIQFALFIPLIGALGILFFSNRPNLRESVTIITSIILFLLVISIFPQVLEGERPSWQAVEMMPGLSIFFEIEPLGMTFGLVASFLWMASAPPTMAPRMAIVQAVL